MIKKILVCDRCGKQQKTETIYSVQVQKLTLELTLMEEDIGRLLDFDFCEECAEQVIRFALDKANNPDVKVAYPVSKTEMTPMPKFAREPGDEDAAIEDDVEDTEPTPWYESGEDGGLPFPDIEQTEEEEKKVRGKRGKVDHERIRELRDSGMSYQEIAEELGLKLNQVKYSIQYYKKKGAKE